MVFFLYWENLIAGSHICFYTIFVNKKDYVKVWSLRKQQESNRRESVYFLFQYFVTSNIKRLCLSFVSGYTMSVLLAAHYFLLLFFSVSAVPLRYKHSAAIHPYPPHPSQQNFWISSWPWLQSYYILLYINNKIILLLINILMQDTVF